LLLVNKKNGTKRPCVDYRELNSRIELDPFPMPLIEELLERMAEFKMVEFWQTTPLGYRGIK
jgi:hypothetical protein